MNRANIHHPLILFCLLAVYVTSFTSQGTPLAQAQTKQNRSTLSTAVTSAVVDALAAELERAMTRLAVPGAARPYNIAYKLTEVEVNDVHASLGSVTASKLRHFVHLEARVHVGNLSRDNSNFVVARAEQVDGVASIQLPLEATPRIARRAAWLVTDNAYKEALAQMNAKADARSAGRGRPEIPSYTRHAAVVQEKPVLVPVLEVQKEVEMRAKEVSASLRDHKHLRDSRVAFTNFLERRWYLNSEGTSAHDTRRVSGVIIVTTAQAPDGQELALYFSRYGQTAADLPDNKFLAAKALSLSKQIRALQKAPVLENYSGPVLFEGIGAAGMVRNTLAVHLGGTPVPENLERERAKHFGGALAGRIGFSQVSRILSVIDDPTQTREGNRFLIGGYRFDDEGVPAQRVEVIRKGKLKTLLMSRTPSKQITKTNGHARRSAPGGSFHGSATNLFIRSTSRLSDKALENRLIAEARRQGLPFGLIISLFDDAAVTAAPELSRRELLALIRTTDASAPPPTAIAYRLRRNGKRELVRGVQLAQVPIEKWENIIATGRKSTVFNYLASGELDLAHRVNVDQGFVPSAGVETSIVTPNLLFKKLNVFGTTAGRKRPIPVVLRP